MKEKIIYSRKLAIELRKLGFKIIKTDVNPKKPQFDVWIFEDSADFQKALADLTNRPYEDRTKGEQKNGKKVSGEFSRCK